MLIVILEPLTLQFIQRTAELICYGTDRVPVLQLQRRINCHLHSSLRRVRLLIAWLALIRRFCICTWFRVRRLRVLVFLAWVTWRGRRALAVLHSLARSFDADDDNDNNDNDNDHTNNNTRDDDLKRWAIICRRIEVRTSISRCSGVVAAAIYGSRTDIVSVPELNVWICDRGLW